MKRVLLVCLIALVAGCGGGGDDGGGGNPAYDLTGAWQANDASCSGDVQVPGLGPDVDDAEVLDLGLDDIESGIEDSAPYHVVQMGSDLEITDPETSETYEATLSGDMIHWERELTGTDTSDGETMSYSSQTVVDGMVLSEDRVEITQLIMSTQVITSAVGDTSIEIEVECTYYLDRVMESA